MATWQYHNKMVSLRFLFKKTITAEHILAMKRANNYWHVNLQDDAVHEENRLISG